MTADPEPEPVERFIVVTLDVEPGDTGQAAAVLEFVRDSLDERLCSFDVERFSAQILPACMRRLCSLDGAPKGIVLRFLEPELLA